VRGAIGFFIPCASADTGGIKCKRRSKKDKLREAAERGKIQLQGHIQPAARAGGSMPMREHASGACDDEEAAFRVCLFDKGTEHGRHGHSGPRAIGHVAGSRRTLPKVPEGSQLIITIENFFHDPRYGGDMVMPGG
jgi:hypothetical protein